MSLDEAVVISELKSGRKEKTYPRSRFGYSQYDTDPRPDVLLLGDWKHPTTGNDLKAGINLHYLSQQQLNRLRKALPDIFRRRNLRTRYRYIKSKMPDVAQFYRTYNTDYIFSWQPDELESYIAGKRKTPKKVDDKAKEKADTKKLADKAVSGIPEPDDKEDEVADTGRDAWAVRRQLYNPDTGRRNRPERPSVSDVGQSRRDKHNRYRSQRRRLRNLERQHEIERLKAQLDKEIDEPDEIEEPETEWPSQAELGDVYEGKDYYYSPRVGFIWASPKSYIKYHGPDIFKPVSEGRTLAVYNAETGEVIIDTAPSHFHMLTEANWDVNDTVRLEIVNDELVVKADKPEGEAVSLLEDIQGKGIIELLVENQR